MMMTVHRDVASRERRFFCLLVVLLEAFFLERESSRLWFSGLKEELVVRKRRFAFSWDKLFQQGFKRMRKQPMNRTERKRSFFASWFNGSIAQKMIAFGIVLVVVIVASLQFIALSYSKKTLIDITSKQAKMLVEQHSASVEEWIGGLLSSVKSTASKRVMTTDMEALVMEQFRLLKQSHKEILKIYLIDGSSGKELYSMTGRNDLDFTQKGYVKKALETKAPVISDEEIVRGAERSILYIASPIGDKNEDTSRLLVVGFSAEQLLTKVQAIPFMNEGKAFVVKSDGLVVAHKDPKQNNQLMLAELPDYKEMLDRMAHKQSDSLLYSDQGNDSFAAFAPIPSLGWNVVLSTGIDEVYGEVNSMGWIILLTSIPIAAIAAFLIWWFAKRIRTSLFAIVQDMERVGSGDFNVHVQVKGNDEIALVGRTLNSMVGELRNLIALVQGQASHLHMAADELNQLSNSNKQAITIITDNIFSISEKVGIQAGEVQSTAATVSEISQGVEQVAIAAESTSVATSRTFDRAQNGMTLVQEVISQVRSASGEVEQTAKRMHSLRDRAKEITSIVEMIRAIASQTNLLALNAAIEAARAGEAGRGFSVVANEVRKLAEESSSFSEKIAGIAHSINDEAMEMSNHMDGIVSKVNEGLISVESVGEAFKHIVSDIQSAAEQSEAMTATSEEMAAGNQVVSSAMQRLSAMSDEINLTIGGVVETVDEQLASIARMTENVEQVKRLAEELTENVKRFVI
jgi:methyl-accepting chemotaxis protein